MIQPTVLATRNTTPLPSENAQVSDHLDARSNQVKKQKKTTPMETL
jgi:hypothetical protein